MAKEEAKAKKEKKNYWKEFKAELKKVIWPTPKQIINNTIAVITIVLITAIIVFVLDLVFDLFNNAGINSLKSRIQNDANIVSEEIEENNDTLEDGDIDIDTEALEAEIEAPAASPSKAAEKFTV